MNKEQLKTLEANSLSVKNAKDLGEHIAIQGEQVGGIFPNGDLTSPDIEKFKEKYGSWWPVARLLMKIAKAFTPDKVDKILDALIELGDRIIVDDEND